MQTMIIPRDDILDDVINNVLKGRHVWLQSPDGYGKTTLLQETTDELGDKHGKEVIFCQESIQFKPLILEIARQLHEMKLLKWSNIEKINELSWPKVYSLLDRPSVIEIAPSVIQSLEGNNIILVLDHLERCGPKYYQYYTRLFEVCTIIAASQNFNNPQIKKLKPYARVIEVPKFTPEQSKQLSDYLYESQKINAHDEENFKLHILRAADNVSLRLIQLYEDASTEKFIDRDYIRKLKTKAGREYVSVGWLFLVMLGMPMAAKIIAVGSGDRDGFIAFGVLSASAFILRYLVYRGSRK